ncbi:MAG: hypothetical protein ACRYG7_14185 [Janthinobacterium lividum]
MPSKKSKPAKHPELVKIKVLRSHPELAYHPGDKGELPAEKADWLIKGGFVEAITNSTIAQ